MSGLIFPDCWIKTDLQSVGNIVTGKTPSKKNPEYFDGQIPFIKPGDINNQGEIKSTSETISQLGAKVVPTIPKGSITVTCIGNLGRAAITSKISATNQQINSLVPSEHINTKYVFYYILTLTEWLNKESSATTVAIINKSKFSMAPISLPPLPEQKVIADKLDTMLAQVETTKARLEKTLETLKQFRQSVLAAAVSGKLTEAWRGGDSELGLPITWKRVKVSTVCDKVQSGSTPRNDPFNQNGTIPFLKVYNIVEQKINFNYKPQFITSDVHNEKLKRSIALPNDVLMNIVGPPLGKVAILTDQYPEWNLNQAITLFRPNKEILCFKYLFFVLCEGELVRDVMPDTKGSVGQVNISLTQCRDALIPLPSIEEQTEIVRRVESLFAQADSIEQQTQAALSKVNNLTQSILAKAFRGELTAQWRAENPELISGDNSAESLLACIKTEREGVVSQKIKRKAKTTEVKAIK